MKKNYTHIVFIMDRSGSMEGLEDDTIGGFNNFVKNQKKEPGDATLTTILFDHEYNVLHDWKNLFEVEPMSNKEYFVRGTTALLDAMGKTIVSVGNKLNSMENKDRPSKVIVVVITDGHENSSVEFTKEKIKEMVEHQRNKYNWEFIFLGANMDAISVANGYGIMVSSNYSATREGTVFAYNAVTKTVANYRSSGTIDENWNKGL